MTQRMEAVCGVTAPHDRHHFQVALTNNGKVRDIIDVVCEGQEEHDSEAVYEDIQVLDDKGNRFVTVPIRREEGHTYFG